MNITAADVKEFQQLFQDKFGITLDEHAARRKLTDLVSQMLMIYKPIKSSGKKSTSEQADDRQQAA